MRLKDFNETSRERLRDYRCAQNALEEALTDEDPRVFLNILREVATAHNFTSVAAKAGVNRQNAYRSLSDSGNPGYLTIRAILNAIGMELGIKYKAKRERNLVPSMTIQPEVAQRLLRCRKLALEKAESEPAAVYEAIMDTSLAGLWGGRQYIGATYFFFDELGEFAPSVLSLQYSDLDRKSDEEIACDLIRLAHQVCADREAEIVGGDALLKAAV